MMRWTILLTLVLSACAPPDEVGQRVGRSLYDASVSTGRAISTAADRTGQALQNAGGNLRNAVNPPPPPLGPPTLPPPYVPDGYAPPAAIQSEPLGPVPSGSGYAPPGPSGYDPYRDEPPP